MGFIQLKTIEYCIFSIKDPCALFRIDGGGERDYNKDLYTEYIFPLIIDSENNLIAVLIFDKTHVSTVYKSRGSMGDL